jgi:hypothetical protein
MVLKFQVSPGRDFHSFSLIERISNRKFNFYCDKSEEVENQEFPLCLMTTFRVVSRHTVNNPGRAIAMDGVRL